MSPTDPMRESPAGADVPAEPTLAELAAWDQEIQPLPHERTSDARACFMFRISVGTLAILGLMASHGISGDANEAMFGWWLGIPLFILWLIVILEGLFGMATTHDHHWDAFKRFLLVACCPPFRAAFSPAYPSRFVWVPRHAWLLAGKLNYERMELRMAVPMLAVSLIVLPLLGLELMLGTWLENHFWAAIIVHTLTAMVWFGFALEFIVMMALTDKKLAYCGRHWVNIAIILLPLVGFLRMFRLLRIGKATKLLRAYRMRGVVARTMRLALVFNLIERLMERNPEKYLLALEDKVIERKAEIQALEEKMTELRQRIAQAKLQETESPQILDTAKEA